MSTETEVTRHTMFHHLADMKIQRKHPRLLAQFENSLEAHLEALRENHTSLVESLQHNVALYQDAYENQKTLTRNACVYDRERWDELYRLRSELESVQNDREEGHDKLQEATEKLASQTQTIIALHRVIKAQQRAQARVQGLLSNEAERKNRLLADCDEWKEQFDRQWASASAAKEIVERQRKAIETLTFELVSVRKQAEKTFFKRFFGWKKHKTTNTQKK